MGNIQFFLGKDLSLGNGMQFQDIVLRYTN